MRELLVREPFEATADSPVASAVQRARTAVLGEEADPVGDTVWMDAAILAAHGIDAVVIGPTGAGAHGAEEWVELESVLRLAEILARAAIVYCDSGGRMTERRADGKPSGNGSIAPA